ncbi:hypothetical protein Moror_15772, partial [Moniliophthora roreri MCA 2997]
PTTTTNFPEENPFIYRHPQTGADTGMNEQDKSPESGKSTPKASRAAEQAAIYLESVEFWKALAVKDSNNSPHGFVPYLRVIREVEHLLKNVRPDQRKRIMEGSDDIILIFPFNTGTLLLSSVTNIHAQIAEKLLLLGQGTIEVLCADPRDPALSVENKFSPPRFFYARIKDAKMREMVLAGQTHSFDEICTFHTLAPNPDRQSWTVGLARSSREIGSEEVLDDLRYGIAVAAWQKPEFFSLIQAATPSKTSDVREHALEFLSTVNATFVRDAEDPKSEPDWLVTAHPITRDYEKQQNILTFLRSLPISHGDSSFTWRLTVLRNLLVAPCSLFAVGYVAWIHTWLTTAHFLALSAGRGQ